MGLSIYEGWEIVDHEIPARTPSELSSNPLQIRHAYRKAVRITSLALTLNLVLTCNFPGIPSMPASLSPSQVPVRNCAFFMVPTPKALGIPRPSALQGPCSGNRSLVLLLEDCRGDPES